jgi:ABC-type glycerol-3-phosphate transport system permease component
MRTYFVNSIITVTASIAIILVASTLAGYALARIKFRGNLFLLVMFIMGDMIPIVVILVPLYILLVGSGLGETRWGLIFSYGAMSMGFSIFLMRGFFRSIPSDIENAALVDGCNVLQLIMHVMIPMIRPGVLVVVIINFIFLWNEYYIASILLPNQDLYTLPAGLAITAIGRYRSDWPAVAAGLVIFTLPILLLFGLAQDKIVSGMTSGIK